MLINKESLEKKLTPLILLVAAVLVGACAPAAGLFLFGGMLKIGEAERSAASTNDVAP